jgi:hypothetical protein
MLEKTERTVSELSSLLRMLQVLPEAQSITKVYLLLLAFCTTWRTFGFERAYLLLVDEENHAVKGQMAAERHTYSDGEPDPEEHSSFETLARSVFKNYEQIESSDLTLKTKTFNIPLDWHRSAVVKAVTSEYPVLAEGRLSEFATDPFLDFFGTNAYLAIPFKIQGRVVAVLAADNGINEPAIPVEDISLVFSLVQHAALAVERLLDVTDNKRKVRVLKKLQDILSNSDTNEKVRESLNLGLAMICRAAGGSGILLKDLVNRKTLHVKAVDEFTVEAGDADLSIGECFESILDRAAGTLRPVWGDSEHALLNEVAGETIRYFFACPMVVNGEGLGAVGVYVETNEINRKHDRFKVKDRVFIELCAGLIAGRLHSVQVADRVVRCETILEEVRSNLVREQESTKLGTRALDYYQELSEEFSDLESAVLSRGTYQKRVERAKDLLAEIGRSQAERRRELASIKFSLRMTDLFKVVAEVVAPWKVKAEESGVEVTVRIPRTGPLLLMNEEKIRLALENILRTLTSCVKDGDKVMVECSAVGERATVAIADTGSGLPGNMLSRLFMPFSDIDQNDEYKSAMTLAGDILHRHAGEIMIKSSTSWKTILIVSFPLVSNKDRRGGGQDRRRRRDRRKPKER